VGCPWVWSRPSRGEPVCLHAFVHPSGGVPLGLESRLQEGVCLSVCLHLSTAARLTAPNFGRGARDADVLRVAKAALTHAKSGGAPPRHLDWAQDSLGFRV
jgi:hypothetical protein